MNMIEQLGISSVEIFTDDSVSAENPTYSFVSEMTLTDFHAQPQGFLNGGATLAFGEIIAGMASNQIGKDAYFAVGQSITANHLNPKKSEGTLTAHGKLLKNGARTHVWQIIIQDENEILISQITVVNALIKQK